MPGRGSTPGSSSPDPDDINNRLAEIAAELAAEAKFKEPTAAERARAAVGPARSPAPPVDSKPGGPIRRWRNRRLAAELRRPIGQPGGREASGRQADGRQADGRQAGGRAAGSRAGGRQPGAARTGRGTGRRSIGGAAAQRAGDWPVPDRGYATPSRRTGAGRSALAIMLVVVLVGGVSFGLRKFLDSRTSRPPASGGTSAPTTHSPTRSSVVPLLNTANPFANSPAASYADGAAGIVLPAPHPVGRYTSAQVAGAFRSVKTLLIAQGLNWTTLRGGRPAAFGRLLIPAQRKWFYGNLGKTGLTSGHASRSSRIWVVAFPPGATKFVGDIIKVHGLPMVASQAKDQGQHVLRVHASYLFVYAVEQPGTSNWSRVVVQLYDTVWFGQWTRTGGPLQLWVSDVNAVSANVVCSINDGYVHPQFDRPGQAFPGEVSDPYALGKSGLRNGQCGQITGT
jgi:hypothetical protein